MSKVVGGYIIFDEEEIEALRIAREAAVSRAMEARRSMPRLGDNLDPNSSYMLLRTGHLFLLD